MVDSTGDDDDDDDTTGGGDGSEDGDEDGDGSFSGLDNRVACACSASASEQGASDLLALVGLAFLGLRRRRKEADPR